jgi:N utilization substance protein A
VTLSRTHPNLVKKLFAMEVPEIASGAVEIAAIAREAGHRSKIAVISHQAGVNAKGACIGPMGSRVRNVMAELHGEKIDIVDYSADPAEFVAHALSPARVTRVHVVDLQARVAQVIVPDYQLSLAIGKEGQNARLAARLTGWRIDIRPDTAEAGPVAASVRPDAAGPADAALADTGPLVTGSANTGPAGTGLADTGLADRGSADRGSADTGLADTGLADTGLADTGPADRGSVDTGPGKQGGPAAKAASKAGPTAGGAGAKAL